MTRPERGLLDTTVLIASENGRWLNEERLPEESAISIVTLAELHAGVLAAAHTDTRGVRLATLDAVADMEVLSPDERTALMWARMRVHLAESGGRVNVDDLWIAATAAAHELPVVTQDSDFEPLEGFGGLTVVRV